ncbi:hypothetical protein BLOT_005420 [Blomia tropicalis]|nr:hypothetical protein BLOT_005420 [Blomia tropicalis]
MINGWRLVSLLSLVELGLGDSCSHDEKEAIGLCTLAAMKDWKVPTAEMGTTSRKFCCFIWNALECQVKIAKRCDWQFAGKISRDTENAYRSICALYPRKSTKCIIQK